MSRFGKGFLAASIFAGAALATRTSAQIVINEIHYNPAATAPVANAEFVELHNPTASPVSIAGWSIADAFGITFPAGTTIPANGYLVVAKDTAQLQATTGYAGALQWTTATGAAGQLSDGGEVITLRNAALTTIDTVNYDDVAPWPTSPDGGGKSLELLNPALDNALAASWGASTPNHGTPGAQNSTARSSRPPRTSRSSAPVVSSAG